jgi:hypothetical protein
MAYYSGSQRTISYTYFDIGNVYDFITARFGEFLPSQFCKDYYKGPKLDFLNKEIVFWTKDMED